MENIQNKSVDPLVVLWSSKWALLLFALVVTGTAIFASSYIPNEYEAKSTILISPPIFNAKAEINRAFLSIENYRDLTLTSGFLQEIIDRLIPKYPDIKNSLHPKVLEGMVRIDTGIQKVQRKDPATLLGFIIRGTDPKLIRDIANAFPKLLSEKSKEMRANEIATISQVTEYQYTSTKAALDKLEQSLQQVRGNNHLDSVIASQKIKHTSLRHFEVQLMRTRVELIEKGSKLSSLMAQSKKYPDMVVEALMSAQIDNESLIAKKKFLVKSIAQLKNEIPQLDGKVLKIDLQEERLEREVTILKSSFLALTKRLTETRISESEKTSDIRLVSNAIEPRFPIWPQRGKVVLIALVLSLVTGAAIALAKEHLDNKLK